LKKNYVGDGKQVTEISNPCSECKKIGWNAFYLPDDYLCKSDIKFCSIKCRKAFETKKKETV
jgi:hypothetical protein